MASITSKIEIATSPARVREVFMNFSRLPEWTQGFIKSIELTDTTKTPMELKAGDKLKVALQGTTFTPTVLANDETQLAWRGSLPFLLTGDHYFRFEPSKTTPGSTTFSHGEDFSGALSLFLWLPLGLKEKAMPQVTAFNEDLKKEAERGS